MSQWIFSNKLNIGDTKGYGEIGRCNEYAFYWDMNVKFPKDCVNVQEKDWSFFLDGYVTNKGELIRELGCVKWNDVFEKGKIEQILPKLRGAFCGFQYDSAKKEFSVFTDHVANRAVYYYVKNEVVLLSNNMNEIARVLRENHAQIELNENAANYMLTYGFMMDDSTFIRNVKRVMPGQYVKICCDDIEIKTYYQIDNTKTDAITEREAVERLDTAFRNAIRREFEKDIEYGYSHLVDLSGGLDSRMVCMVAHDMGYTKQMNFTYCRPKYLDQSISEKIASDLQHEYIFKSLDDRKWMLDIDEVVEKNNGAALFSGITGGNRFLKSIDTTLYGIEHTGMIGDAIVSTFYQDEKVNYGRPQWGRHRYSEKLKTVFNDAVLERYPNQEICAIYTRGILGAQSSYIIRQHYLETASPFMDVDFLDACFSVPFMLRKKHHIYLKWIKEKYPQACEYGWEKWGGIKPKENLIYQRRIVTLNRLLYGFLKKVIGRANDDSMNPMDYWFEKDKEVQNYYQEYYQENINHQMLPEKVRNDVKVMFESGNYTEKAMALTVLAVVKKYFK